MKVLPLFTVSIQEQFVIKSGASTVINFIFLILKQNFPLLHSQRSSLNKKLGLKRKTTPGWKQTT